MMITSANTSINKNKLPATFKRVVWRPGQVNLDIGGGKFDNATDYLEALGVRNLHYDPYNKPLRHNAAVLHGAYNVDTVTVNNVLNVIPDLAERRGVIKLAYKRLRPSGVAYFLIYEGNKSGVGKKTRCGWQEGRKTDSYLWEVEKVFGYAVRKGNMIIAKR